MSVVGLVMAGGRGTRIASRVEKPLISLGGKTMLELVVEALKGASRVEEIAVTTSPHTPKTKEMAKKLGLKTIETQGEDYVADAQQAIRTLVPKTVLVISADLPLVSSRLIDDVIEQYIRCGRPSLKVVTSIKPNRHKDEKGPTREGESARPVGMNVIDSRHINQPQIDEATFLVNSKEVAANVNTPEDLKELLQQERSQSNTAVCSESSA